MTPLRETPLRQNDDLQQPNELREVKTTTTSPSNTGRIYTQVEWNALTLERDEARADFAKAVRECHPAACRDEPIWRNELEIREAAIAAAIREAAEHTPISREAGPDDPSWLISRGACSCGKLVADGVTPWNKLWREHILALTPATAIHAEKLLVAQEIEPWRRLLWLNHAQYLPFTHTPYGDDGKMQCCGINFKQWSAKQIEEQLDSRTTSALETIEKENK